MGQSLNLQARLFFFPTLGLLIATAAQFFPSAVTHASLPPPLLFVTPSSLSLTLFSLSLFPQLDHRRSRSLEIWDVSRPFQRQLQSIPPLGGDGEEEREGGLSLRGNVKGYMSGEPAGVFSPLVQGQHECARSHTRIHTHSWMCRCLPLPCQI